MARPLALFLGVFALANLAGGLIVPGFDANVWWIDLRPLPAPLADLLLAVAATTLVAYALFPRMQARRRRFTNVVLACLVAATLLDAARFFALWGGGAIRSAFPVPLSLLVAAALVAIARGVRRPGTSLATPRAAVVAAVTLCGCIVGLPLALMLLFGSTDYRRRADAVVVFGARAYADGRASDALADRVRTGARLVRDGYAHWLVVSGGPGDGAFHETDVMRRLAVEAGVERARIVVDRHGLSTEATVARTIPIFRSLGAREILAVSHFYHLARVRLAYQRAGWDVRTVPARERRMLAALPVLLARDVVALWYYWGSPLARSAQS